MGITLTFINFEEMIAYARQLLGSAPETKAPVKQDVAPTYQQPVQQQPSQPVTQQPVQQVPQQTVQQPVQQNVPAQGAVYQQTPAQAQPVPTTTPNIQQQQPVQTVQTSYTCDNLANAAMTLMDAGRQAELLNLLSQFGVDNLPALQPEQYGAFATALRGLGAQI